MVFSKDLRERREESMPQRLVWELMKRVLLLLAFRFSPSI